MRLTQVSAKCCLLLLGAFFGLSSHASSADPKPTLTVHLDPKKDILHITLHNHSSRTIETNDLFVPWKNFNSIVLVAEIPLLNGLELPFNQIIDDLGPTITVIKPGERIAGDIDLDERFPSLKRTRSKNEVVVFWTFQLKSNQSKEIKGFPREGGWVLLPRLHQ